MKIHMHKIGIYTVYCVLCTGMISVLRCSIQCITQLVLPVTDSSELPVQLLELHNCTAVYLLL